MLNKKLKSYKDSLVLTNDMRGIIVGLLLGDANLQTFTKEGKTWRLRIIHLPPEARSRPGGERW